jgi:hypothetical protein
MAIAARGSIGQRWGDALRSGIGRAHDGDDSNGFAAEPAGLFAVFVKSSGPASQMQRHGVDQLSPWCLKPGCRPYNVEAWWIELLQGRHS